MAKSNSVAVVGAGPVGLCLALALAQQDVSVVLIGISELVHVDEAVAAAARGPLSPEELARIEAVRLADFS